jgi:GNAT superfamily N-acetyltransferase
MSDDKQEKLRIVAIEPERDAAVVHRIFQAAYAQEAELLRATFFPPLQRTCKDIEVSDNSFFAAVRGREYTGVLELEVDNGQTVIASLVVSPAFSRQGIGLALVQFALSTAKQLEVMTGELNHPAVKLYTQLGFNVIEHFQTPEDIPMVRLQSASRID